jgi:predicted nucleic acid-binding protein
MTDAVIVDTDVFSYWIKGDSRGRLYEADARDKTVCIAFMTLAETKRWALVRNWGPAKRKILADAIARCVVLPFDEPLADAWAEISHARARSGRPMECGDCWIAPCAVRHSLPLLTHNRRHYEGVPRLEVVSHG